MFPLAEGASTEQTDDVSAAGAPWGRWPEVPVQCSPWLASASGRARLARRSGLDPSATFAALNSSPRSCRLPIYRAHPSSPLQATPVTVLLRRAIRMGHACLRVDRESQKLETDWWFNQSVSQICFDRTAKHQGKRGESYSWNGVQSAGRKFLIIVRKG